MIIPFRFVWLYMVILLATMVSCTRKNHSDFTIATAANVQFAMEELLKEFEAQTGYHGEMVLGSSGKLTAQLKEGAPYDLFVSADMLYPDELYQTNLTYGPPKPYAFGLLVLWTASKQREVSLKTLQENSIVHVAIANTTTAPYGRATKEVLLKSGLWDIVGPKLVYGESIAQVNQFITSQSAQLGFTAKSIVVSEEMKNVGRWIEVDPTLYSPIEQGIVKIRRKNQNLKAIDKFYQFMFEPSAHKILLRHGYTIKKK